ncbi:hypothetical protein [Nocardia sp. NPDC019302]|uniref:hypothetical protein n=1 Tax=Nocardia sp. NPDC019302 TaxID=3154592 RepID=UPI0033CEFABC
MEDVDVPVPNPFITEWLRSATCRSMVRESAELYEALYREIVAKRTGRLAASTHVSTGIEGGRWAGMLAVTVSYAASHEYGTGRTDPSHHLPAANDLNQILDLMGTL